jgi:hypothetical protein
MHKNEEAAKKKETGGNPDHEAPRSFSNFVNYNSVRDMFNEVNAQLDKKVPKMVDDISKNQYSIIELQTQQNSQQAAIEQLQETAKEIFMIKMNHNNLCKNVEMEGQRIVSN